jgi:hypothetical protein
VKIRIDGGPRCSSRSPWWAPSTDSGSPPRRCSARGRSGDAIAYFDFATTTTLLFAVVTPLAFFAHARLLFGDTPRALLAAGIVAVLPTHVRFSHSEVEFVPSLALSAFTFVLVHIAVADPRPRWRALAAVVLPVVAIATFVTRPLNVVFLPLFLIDALVMHRETAPLRRRLVATALASAAGGVAIVVHLLPTYGQQVRDGADPAVLVRAVGAFFTLKWNTLIHPGITPPVLLLCAVLGAVWAWRSERKTVAFLLGWLAAFFVAHAYVLPEETAMQVRYHLHLVPPFVLLAAIGLARLLRRDARAGWIAAALVAVSPLVHLGFVRDVAFNDQREYAFVRAAAASLPDDCTVLEHTGELGDHEARFARAGAVLDGWVERRRFRVQPVGAEPGSADPLREEARRALEGPGCVVWYEGIPCFRDLRGGEPIARACAAMREAVPLEPLAEHAFESRLYDANLDPRADRVRLTLSRVR